MAFIIIDRTDANAIFAGDLIGAVRTVDQLYAQLEKMSNKMAEMTTSEIETLYGLPEGVGEIVKDIVDGLKGGLESGMADQFRSQLG